MEIEAGRLENLQFPLTVSDITEIAKQVARETVDKINEEEEKKRERCSPEKAAKRMLSEYRRLKKVATMDLQPTKEEALSLYWQYLEELMGNPDNKLYAENKAYIIERKLQYNRYKVQKIEKAIQLYEEECKSYGGKEELKRCRIIKALYITDPKMSVQEIADIEGISDKTVYKDIKIAEKAIAVYLAAM